MPALSACLSNTSLSTRLLHEIRKDRVRSLWICSRIWSRCGMLLIHRATSPAVKLPSVDVATTVRSSLVPVEIRRDLLHDLGAR